MGEDARFGALGKALGPRVGLGHRAAGDLMMDWQQYWDKHYAEGNVTGADFTFGEEVWNAAQSELLNSLLSAGDDAFPPQRPMDLPPGGEPVVVSVGEDK